MGIPPFIGPFCIHPDCGPSMTAAPIAHHPAVKTEQSSHQPTRTPPMTSSHFLPSPLPCRTRLLLSDFLTSLRRVAFPSASMVVSSCEPPVNALRRGNGGQ